MTVITFSTQRSKYEYETYPINSTTWNSVGGNYIFSFETQTGWVPLYVGQTNNFKARFSNHDKLPLAIKRGATHILAHVNTSDQSRMSEEADLINWFKPVLNELLK